MPSGVYERTEETKKILSKAKSGENHPNYGKHRTNETKEKIKLANLGKHHTEEAIKKMRLAKLGKPSNRLGKHHTKETKEKLRLFKLGKPSCFEGRNHTEESKEKMRIAHLGKSTWIKGRQHTNKTKEKMSLNHANVSGKNSPSWRGGISFEPYTPEFNKQLKELIRNRDGYKCQKCGMPECENIRKLDIHHIDYIKKNCLPDNLITLCRSCNGKVNINRDYWTEYFQNKIRVNKLCLIEK